MTPYRNTVSDLETKLRQHYGPTFDEKLQKVLPNEKTRLGALNRLNKITETNVTLEGAYLGKSVRTDRKTNNITSVYFRVLDANGKGRRIYLHDLEFADSLPEEPPRLSGVRWNNLQKTTIVSNDVSSYRTTGNTTFNVDENIDVGLMELTTFNQAVEIKKTSTRDRYFTVLGEIVDVNVGEDKENDRRWISAELEDLDGTRFRVALDKNLPDLFGDADWLDDYQEAAQNLYHMLVLANGRIFQFEKRDGSQGVTLTIKNGGWIVDVTKTPAKLQEKLQKVAFSK